MKGNLDIYVWDTKDPFNVILIYRANGINRERVNELRAKYEKLGYEVHSWPMKPL